MRLFFSDDEVYFVNLENLSSKHPPFATVNCYLTDSEVCNGLKAETFPFVFFARTGWQPYWEMNC